MHVILGVASRPNNTPNKVSLPRKSRCASKILAPVPTIVGPCCLPEGSPPDPTAQTMTLEQVKAARPTADFDPVYGTTTGMWPTGRFIETVYADLKTPWNGSEPAAKSGLNFIDGGR